MIAPCDGIALPQAQKPQYDYRYGAGLKEIGRRLGGCLCVPYIKLVMIMMRFVILHGLHSLTKLNRLQNIQPMRI